MSEKSLSKRLWHYFLTGLFVLIPVGLTTFIVVWTVQVVDRLFGFTIPGLGLVVTAGLVIVLGMVMSNVFGQQFFELFEELILFRIPGVRAVYKTVKSLTNVFSPNSHTSFRHVVMVEYPREGALSLGFVTSELEFIPHGGGSARWVSVYVPTNHMYLGNTVLIPEHKVLVTDLSVPEAVQIILAGGASFPERVKLKEPEKV